MNYDTLLEEFKAASATDQELAYQKVVVYGAKLASELEAITQLIDLMNKTRTPDGAVPQEPA